MTKQELIEKAAQWSKIDSQRFGELNRELLVHHVIYTCTPVDIVRLSELAALMAQYIDSLPDEQEDK